MTETNRKQANWTIFLVYSAALVILVWHHEMWRDELQTWGIVASAHTWADLIQNTRYEGHPMLWFILVWPVAQLVNNPVAIQVFHTILVLITASLIVFRSPFSVLEKILILFSYYFLYEYGAITRNYQIGILLMCLICILWKHPHTNLLTISVLLFLLVQANAFAFLIGLGLALGLLMEEYQAKTLWPLTARHIGAALIILLGIYLSSLAVPPGDSSFLTGWITRFDPGTVLFALSGIAHGFLPITGFDEYYFWNYSSVPLGALPKLIIGTALLVVAFFSMPKDKVALSILCACVLFIFAFTYTKPRGNLRHFGHYTLALVAAFWIQGNRTVSAPKRLLSIGYFGLLVLITQLVAGINAYYRDLCYPFSNAEKVADYIKKQYPANISLAGAFQDMLTSVRWYAQKPIFYLDIEEYGSFVMFNKKHWNDTLNAQPDSVTYARYINFQKTHQPALLVMGYHALPVPKEGQVDTLRTADGVYLFTCAKAFEGAITREDFYLFDVKRATN
ncbi:hypothetical protein [Spirosoma sp. KNUC1025]|uniref:hypothetical protein n=1 Tax=Spirosoma sp. KNUC1025 TaxID=2894082 RepID=UPI00386484E8|nr:hypothetical protein LN737_18780 [Spirosoma sp. KNUC1025]